MTLSFSRCMVIAFAVALFVYSPKWATAMESTTSPCVDRQVSEPGVAAGSSRLDELEYECLRLRSGRHVLIGRAGTQGQPTMLLVHGLGNAAHRDWRKLIPTLAGSYRVVALDLPGFGASEAALQGYSFDNLAATLAEVLDRESVQRAHVAGHSLGGAVSLYFAHAYPNRVERLVLIDAAGILLKSVYVHHVSRITTPELGIPPLDFVLGVFDQRVNGLSRLILQQLENRPDFSSWLAKNPQVRIALLGRFTQTDAALGLIEHDFTRAIRETQAPTTIIWGREDDVSPVRVGKLLAGRMQNARLHVFDRVGHVPMNAVPELVAPLLLQNIAARTAESPRIATFATEPPSVECSGDGSRVYSGHFAIVKLTGCRDVLIHDARIDKLIAMDSSVTLESVSIGGQDVGIEATNSFITATVADISARVGVSASNSQLDLAGTTIRAGERALRFVTPNRVYFSVSDIAAPEFSGDVHRIWVDIASP